jgi:carbon-monoxide dehydrogenase iron sulfur subunit
MPDRLLVIETERCVGCQSCMFACSRRQDVAGLIKSCINVRSIGGMERGFTVVVCRACDDPPCARVCPTDALVLREGGGVRLDMKKCIGCGHCRDACLIGAIQWDDTIEKPMICIHCGYCVEFCPHKVLGMQKKEAKGHVKR